LFKPFKKFKSFLRKMCGLVRGEFTGARRLI